MLCCSLRLQSKLLDAILQYLVASQIELTSVLIENDLLLIIKYTLHLARFYDWSGWKFLDGDRLGKLFEFFVLTNAKVLTSKVHQLVI